MLSERTTARLRDIVEDAYRIVPDQAALIGPALPFAAMRGLGNRLTHEYCGLDRSIVFEIARLEVPALAAAAELLLEKSGD